MLYPSQAFLYDNTVLITQWHNVTDCCHRRNLKKYFTFSTVNSKQIIKHLNKLVDNNRSAYIFKWIRMPSTPEAIEVYLSNGILYGPAKASNAGGVATSGLEMSQNSERLSWSFEEVDAKLKGIMEGIFHASYDASVAAGSEGNLMVGANCAGFLKVATAMMAQGITY